MANCLVLIFNKLIKQIFISLDIICPTKEFLNIMKLITLYELYDSRYTSDKDRAICYSVCESLAEAKKEKKEMFPDAIIVKSISKEVGERQLEEVSSEVFE
jgi:hypothetical protein